MTEHKYIECEAAIAVLEEKQKELCPVGMYSRNAVYGSDREKFDEWQEIIDTLESIAPADVVSRDYYDKLLRENEELRKERPVAHGKWINDHNGRYSPLGDNFLCSVCKEPSLRAYGKPAKTNFCSNCGADLREER